MLGTPEPRRFSYGMNPNSARQAASFFGEPTPRGKPLRSQHREQRFADMRLKIPGIAAPLKMSPHVVGASCPSHSQPSPTPGGRGTWCNVA